MRFKGLQIQQRKSTSLSKPEVHDYLKDGWLEKQVINNHASSSHALHCAVLYYMKSTHALASVSESCAK